jgi:hypothetical protein
MDDFSHEQLNSSILASHITKTAMPVSPIIQKYQQMLDDLKNEIEEIAQHQINDYYSLLLEIQSPKSVNNIEDIIQSPNTKRKFLVKKKNYSYSAAEPEMLSVGMGKKAEESLQLDMDVILNGKDKTEDSFTEFFVTTLNSPLPSPLKAVPKNETSAATNIKAVPFKSSTTTKFTANPPNSPQSREETFTSVVSQRLLASSPSPVHHKDCSSRLWVEFPNRSKAPWLPNNAKHSSGSRNIITRYSLQQRNRFSVLKKGKPVINSDESILTPRRKASLDTGTHRNLRTQGSLRMLML